MGCEAVTVRNGVTSSKGRYVVANFRWMAPFKMEEIWIQGLSMSTMQR